jgi:hypothetical protein
LQHRGLPLFRIFYNSLPNIAAPTASRATKSIRATLTAYVNGICRTHLEGEKALTIRETPAIRAHPSRTPAAASFTPARPGVQSLEPTFRVVSAVLPAPETRRSGRHPPYYPVHPRDLRQASNIPHRGTATALAERPQSARKLPSPRQFPEPPQIRQMLEHGIETGGLDIPEVDTRVVQTVETALNHVQFCLQRIVCRQ